MGQLTLILSLELAYTCLKEYKQAMFRGFGRIGMLHDEPEEPSSIISAPLTNDTTSTIKSDMTQPDAASGASSRQHIKRKHRFTVFAARCLLTVLLLFGFACSVLPWGRAFVRTTLLLPSLITGSEPEPLKVLGDPVRHMQMTIPSQNGTVYLDIYAPTTPVPWLPHARSGVLILPGVGDQRGEAQLINLAQSLAQSGIIAIYMTTDTLLSNEVAAADSDGVVQAFQVLAHQPGLAGQHLGMMAFSAGVPLACFAAADPRIRDDVAYIAAFGGYFNTESAIKAVGRRAVMVDGKLEPWHPVAYSVEVLANVITRPLPFDEQIRIRAVFAPGGTPLAPQEIAHLSPGARAAYELLIGSEPDKVDANMAALPPAVRAELVSLSPSRVIGEIRAPIFLLHDRNDGFLPFTESRDFAAALTRLHHEHDYVEFHIFDHVEVKSHLDLAQILGDGSRLFSVTYRVLQLAS